MEISRTLWKNDFTEDNVPKWPCPTCGKGTLTKREGKSVKSFESTQSLADKSDDAWEPYWIRGSFLGVLECSNSDCKETIVVTGKMWVEDGYEYDEETDMAHGVYYTILTPQYFVPALQIFQINKDVPEKIKDAIVESFRLFWTDPSSCANKVRIAIELIMDDKKIVKYIIDKKKNKRIGISLHARIEKFRLINPSEADFLMAIKWIGNVGSHSPDPINKDDVLDAYEILNHVTTVLYEKETKRISKLSKTINKSRKPLSKKKTKRKKISTKGI